MNLYLLAATPWSLPQHLCDLHLIKMTYAVGQTLAKVMEKEEFPAHRDGWCGFSIKVSGDDPHVKWASESRYNFGILLLHLSNLVSEVENRFRFEHDYRLFAEFLYGSNMTRALMNDLGLRNGFNDRSVYEMMRLGTLPPNEFPLFYQQLFKTQLQIALENAEEGDIPQQWKTLVDIHRMYYTLDIYPKEWASWKFGTGTPDFIQNFLRNNKTWSQELDKKSLLTKIPIPRAKGTIEAYVDQYDPLPYKLVEPIQEKEVAKKIDNSSKNFSWAD